MKFHQISEIFQCLKLTLAERERERERRKQIEGKVTSLNCVLIISTDRF
jgi:hypothetical protein